MIGEWRDVNWRDLACKGSIVVDSGVDQLDFGITGTHLAASSSKRYSMSPRKDFVILNEYYCFRPEEEHPLLGRICKNANEPNANYFPLDPTPYHGKDLRPLHIDAKDPTITVNSAESSAARLSLDRIFRLLREKQKDRTSSWHAERVRTFILPQEDEVLRNILSEKPLLDSINEMLGDKDSLYMITGYMTLFNAHFSNDGSRSMSTEVETSLTRIIEAAAQGATGAPLRLPELVAAFKRSSELHTSWEASYAEETVVAVKYRQVAKKWQLRSWLLEEKIRLGPAQIRGADMFGSGSDGK